MTFIVRSHAWAWECPRCGRELGEHALRGASDPRAADSIARTLSLARTAVEMDVAMLTEVRDGKEVVRHVAGEWAGVGPVVGASLPLDDTICKQMLDGRIGNVVADAAHDPQVKDLLVTRALGVGAWIGMPLATSLARLYVLCCLSREARPALNRSDTYRLTGFVASLEVQLAGSAENAAD